MAVQVNQLLRLNQAVGPVQPGLFRVVLIDRPGQQVCLFKMRESGSGPGTRIMKPDRVSLALVDEALEAETAVTVQVAEVHAPPHASGQGEASQKRYARNQKLLAELVEPLSLHRMLIGNDWTARLREVSSRHGVSESTAGRLLCLYLACGLSITAAATPSYWKPRPHRTLRAKQGRPYERKRTGYDPTRVGRNSTDRDRTHVNLIYQARDGSRGFSYQGLFNKYRVAYGHQRVNVLPDGTTETVHDDDVNVNLSARQFRYLLKKIVGEEKLKTDAAGERTVLLQNRPALGNARERCPYPGHTYILDATVADVYLVSSFDRRRLIGRPVVYVVVDAFSSLIVGVHVALSGPNFEEARIAMYRAVADRSQWLKWLGLEELVPLLPRGCRPTFWFADRGELHSTKSRATQISLETSLSIAAAYRAEWKSIVERVFGILNTDVIHWMPGTTHGKPKARGDEDPRLEAALTLKEFTRVILRNVAILNLTRNMSDHLSATQVRVGTPANPIGFWNYGIENIHGSATYLSEQEGVQQLLAGIGSTVERTGVTGSVGTYVAPWMLEHKLVKLAGHGQQIGAILYRSPDQPGTAWCALPGESTLRSVELKRSEPIDHGACTEDVMDLEAIKKFAGQDLQDSTSVEHLALSRAVEQDIKKAKKLTAEAHRSKPISKAAAKSDIKTNREKENASLYNPASASQCEPASMAEALPDDSGTELSAETTTVQTVDQHSPETPKLLDLLAAQVGTWG